VLIAHIEFAVPLPKHELMSLVNDYPHEIIFLNRSPYRFLIMLQL